MLCPILKAMFAKRVANFKAKIIAVMPPCEIHSGSTFWDHRKSRFAIYKKIIYNIYRKDKEIPPFW